MALTPAEKMRRYRARLKETSGNEKPLPSPRYPRDLIRAYDEADPHAKLALVQHIASELLRVAASEAGRSARPENSAAAQIDVEEFIAASAPTPTTTTTTTSAPILTPAKGKGNVWRGAMPAACRADAQARGFDDARVAELWAAAQAQKPNWVAGVSLLGNVSRDFRRWLAKQP